MGKQRVGDGHFSRKRCKDEDKTLTFIKTLEEADRDAAAEMECDPPAPPPSPVHDTVEFWIKYNTGWRDTVRSTGKVYTHHRYLPGERVMPIHSASPSDLRRMPSLVEEEQCSES